MTNAQATDLELIERTLRDGLASDDPDGDRVRGAADRLAWSAWRERNRRDWASSDFNAWTDALWSRARRACDDCPARASLEYARAVVQAIRPERAS